VGTIQANVEASVKPPRVDQGEKIRILDQDQIERTLRHWRGAPCRPIVALALASGARRGELLALRLKDLNVDAGTLRVDRSLEQTKGRLRFKSRRPRCQDCRRIVEPGDRVGQSEQVKRMSRLLHQVLRPEIIIPLMDELETDDRARLLMVIGQMQGALAMSELGSDVVLSDANIAAVWSAFTAISLVRCRPWRGSMLETLGRRINKFPRWQFWPDMLRSAVMPG
jgi:hypothetical protein